MKKLIMIAIVALAAQNTLAGNESIPSIKVLQPKTFTVIDGDELDAQKGFGDDEAMTRMMNLMMVEGSGYEGMDMEGMSHEARVTESSSGYEIEVLTKQVKVGTSVVEFSVKENSKPAKGLNLKSQVFMTSMDMGIEEPKVQEVSAGKYQVKAPFTMRGLWALKLIFPNGKEQVFNFNVNSK